MKLRLFTDPHLGVSRQAHTTRESSKRLARKLFKTAMAAKTQGSDTRAIFSAGDLFDKTYNSEAVILQGMDVAEDCYILAGNHDLPNRSDVQCSLDVVQQTWNSKVVKCVQLDEPSFQEVLPGVLMVPHHANQDLFEQALTLAVQAAKDGEGNRVLFVHCNRGFIPEDSASSTLLITDRMEAYLLQTFTRIFYGHEHKATENLGSRAFVLGNTHPTSFSDISDKYCYDYDLETDELVRHKLWGTAPGYLRVALGADLKGEVEGIEFVDVEGQGTRKEAADYLQHLWETLPDALAIRSKVEYVTEDGVIVTAGSDPVDLRKAISKDLEGTEMGVLFEELCDE